MCRPDPAASVDPDRTAAGTDRTVADVNQAVADANQIVAEVNQTVADTNRITGASQPAADLNRTAADANQAADATGQPPGTGAHAWLDAVRWDDRGLVAAIAQDAASGRVLMMAWMNREALAETATGSTPSAT